MMTQQPESPRVLVTGAGGFIGGRVVEALLQDGRYHTVPAVRRWSTAARIGRYPVSPVRFDLLDPAGIRAGLEGVESVIHCAVGDREATVDGTRNLLEAALALGVRRVVHLSTIDVYGRATGDVDESVPRTRTGRAYGDAKIEAEEVCEAFAARGLEVVVLRPTIVYGPFSDSWTVEFGERLARGQWFLPNEACQGTCNLVYVDDLVRAVLLALEAPGAGAKAYNINGPERPTWQAYVELLNRELGLPDLKPPPPASARTRTRLVEPVRQVVKVAFKRFQGPVLALYRRSRLARAVMKRTEAALRSVPSPSEYDLYGRRVAFPSVRAEAELGYRPSVTMGEGVRRSAEWLRHEGVVQNRA
jgi:nucleoside-diphosphate-sugar epimerase